MKKSIKLATSIISLTLCASFLACAETNDKVMSIQEKHAELANMCQYYPEECEFAASGAGNGGGNEPPYTPRKPKKTLKVPENET